MKVRTRAPSPTEITVAWCAADEEKLRRADNAYMREEMLDDATRIKPTLVVAAIVV